MAGALLNHTQMLLDKNINTSVISEGYQIALDNSMKIIEDMEKPIDLDDNDTFVQNAITSLSSKVSNYTNFGSNLVDAV